MNLVCHIECGPVDKWSQMVTAQGFVLVRQCHEPRCLAAFNKLCSKQVRSREKPLVWFLCYSINEEMFCSCGQTQHTVASCNSFLVLSKLRLSSRLLLLKWCWLLWLYSNLLKRSKTAVFWDGSVRIQTWDFSDPAAPTGQDLLG